MGSICIGAWRSWCSSMVTCGAATYFTVYFAETLDTISLNGSESEHCTAFTSISAGCAVLILCAKDEESGRKQVGHSSSGRMLRHRGSPETEYLFDTTSLSGTRVPSR
jgi:hypothetical protein